MSRGAHDLLRAALELPDAERLELLDGLTAALDERGLRTAGGSSLRDLSAAFASLPRLSEEDAAEFARDLDEARDELAGRPAEDRWAS